MTTSKIRVVVNAGQDNTYSRVVEVEAWNTSSVPSSINLNWLVADQLGTPRMVFDKAGSLATTKRHDYLPFGEELFAGMGGRTTVLGYTSDTVRQKFTLKERDNETGLDYFLARYYSSMQGRFTSPDEFTGGSDEYYEFSDLASQNPTFYADLTDPQSLNKYHYAYNNPLLYIDPDGHQGVREYARRVFEGGKAVVKAGADTQIAVDKVAANLVIGAMNIGNAAIGGPQTAPYEPSGAVQEIAMHALEVGTLFSPLAGKGGPATVMVAETKQTTVVSAEVGNARVASAASKSTSEMAGELSAQLGKNSVDYRTPNKVGHIDLKGKAHFDKSTGQRIATPHVQERAIHRAPNGRTNVGRQTTRPATKQDIRTARRIVEHRRR